MYTWLKIYMTLCTLISAGEKNVNYRCELQARCIVFGEDVCHRPCENEVGFIGTVLELSGTHFNGTFWDNHLIPINPNIGIIWY